MYKNKNLTPKEKALDLLSKMTLDEKLGQMNIYMRVEDTYNTLLNDGKLEERGCIFVESSSYSAEHFNAVQEYYVKKSRLGIPILLAGEGIRGVLHKSATIFPQCAGLGGSFDCELLSEISDIIGQESAALGIRQLYAPDLDIPRDPRWGRMQECYGEDPYLVGEMGSAYVKGIQSHDVAATLKHFIAYGIPENGINLAPAHMGEREMREVTLEPFKKCIKAGALSVMPSYNELDGEAVHASQRLLRSLLREELGFDGMTISDYGAIEMLTKFHNVAETRLEASKMALMAGVDMEAPEPYGYAEELKNAILRGEIDEKLVDEAVLNILTLKFRIGLFENPYIPAKSTIHTDKASALSCRADEESILLLKNDGILPFSPDKAGKVAVIGNNAKYSFLGDYTLRNENCIDFYTGIVNRLGKDNVLYSKGCNSISYTEEMIESAVKTASEADTVFLVLGDDTGVGGGIGGEHREGENELTCGEGYDTHELVLPPSQRRLFNAISDLGKPTVLILYAGRPYAIAPEVSRVNGFMFSWGGGEQSGTAFANLIFGDVSPSAKLSVSFPQSTGHIPCYYNHKVSARGSWYKKPGSIDNPGRDYVLSSPDAWYAFGCGLSYTTVKYSDLSVKTLNNRQVMVSVTIENIGKYDINESVLLFLRVLYSPITPFVKRLRKFKKVFLKKGAKKNVEFVLNDDDFTYVDANFKTTKLPGKYKIMIQDLVCDVTIE